MTLSSSSSTASLVVAALAALAGLASVGGRGEAVYYRRRPNYYVTSPYQRSPVFTSYQHVPPQVDLPIVAMVRNRICENEKEEEEEMREAR